VWAFQPGDKIRCSERVFSDGRKGMVATKLVGADA